MSFNIGKISSKIANSSFVTALPKKASNFATSFGAKVDSLCVKDKFSKAVNALEPTGGDNSWLLMLGLMFTMVVGPRIATAAKRNPDNKEATKDEISEILFRDIQTIAIIMLALKALNALISGAAGKFSGIPMSNKPYEQMFNTKGIKNKAIEFAQEPFAKIGTFAKNVWATVNPLGGKMSYTKEQSIEKYSGQGSLEEIKKLFKSTEAQKGNPDKIFNIVTDSLIQEQNDKLLKLKSDALSSAFADGKFLDDMNKKIEQTSTRLDDLLQLKEAGYENFINGKTQINKSVENLMVSFFKDKNNSLVKKVVNLTAWLKTIAYGIEVGYLGFGLPFLNQKRLEKKYLNTQPKASMPDTMHEIKNAAVKNVKLKEQEVKLFSNFIK